MDMIIDFVLLAVSGAAAFYCAVLNRRLGKLMDAEKGIGVGIASMSQALDETRGVLQYAQESCRRSIDELAPMLVEAKKHCEKLGELTDIASEMTDLAAEDIERAADSAIARISRASVAAAPRTRPAHPDAGAFHRPPGRDMSDALQTRGLEHLLG
jgi:hypothetical protein